MLRLILYLFFFISISETTVAQTNDFDKLADNLLLRIPSYRTDSVTHSFLKKYVPLIATKETGRWSAYPPIENPPPEVLTRHSLEFIKHPFVDLPIKDGRLDILTREANGKVVGFRTYYVSFLFENKQKAEHAFDRLCKMFTPISTSRRIVQKGNKRVAVFSNKKSRLYLDEVQFILTQDEMFDNKYKILFGQILDQMFTKHYGLQN